MPKHHTDTPRAEQAEVEYRDVAGFPGYRVGDDGSVWSRWGLASTRLGRFGPRALSSHWKRLRGHVNSKNRVKVLLYRAGRSRCCFVHRLVLEAFVGPCPDGMETRHVNDPDPRNNRLDNLRWGTHAENLADKVRHGNAPVGVKNPRAKLTPDEVRQIRREAAEGVRFNELAARFGVCRSNIEFIVARVRWKMVE